MDVFSTERLATSSISDILDDPRDDFGRLETAVSTSVKLSHEKYQPGSLNHLSVIVAIKSWQDNAGPEQLSVLRYYQDVVNRSIEYEYLFDLVRGPYDDIFLFDDFLITLSSSNLLEVVYFKEHIGATVPRNFMLPLYM